MSVDSEQKTVKFIIKNGGQCPHYKDKRLPRLDKSGFAMTPNEIINHYKNVATVWRIKHREKILLEN